VIEGNKAPGRSVPTLTDVVTVAPMVADASAAAGPDEELVRLVMHSFEEAAMARLQALVERLASEQADSLRWRLRAEIEPLIRDCVRHAVAQHSADAKLAGTDQIQAAR
jgi:hypothetical protein